MTTLALPAAPASSTVLILSNEYLDARAGFAGDARSVGEFRQAEASGLVKWTAGNVHIDAAAVDVIVRVREFQEQQRRDAAILGELFPVPSPEALKVPVAER